jgi:restriction system protein
MPIPDFQTVMLPLPTFTSDGNEHSLRETIEHLANHFNLTADERQELLPSGAQAIFDNRVGWAKTHLLKAGLVESPRRSIFKITAHGLQVLGKNPQQININFLRQFPSYAEFLRPTTDNETSNTATQQIDNSQATPEEILEGSYQNIR